MLKLQQPLPLPKLILLLGDAIFFGVSITIALLVRHHGLPEHSLLKLYFFATPFLLALWTFGFFTFGLYDLRAAKNEPRFFDRLLRALVFNAVVTFLLFYLIPEFRLTPIVTMAIIFLAEVALVSAWRIGYNAALARISSERILFFGLGDEVREVALHLRRNPQLGYAAVLGIALEGDLSLVGDYGFPTLSGAGHSLPELIRQYRVNTVIVSPAIKTNSLLTKIIFEVIPLGVTAVEFSRFYEYALGKIPTSLIGEVWFLENLIGSRRPHYEFLKRIFDLTLAFFVGVITLAALPFIAAAIALSTPRQVFHYRRLRAHTGDGIVFFRQARIGLAGKTFGFIKFRSQVLGAERFGGEKLLDDTQDPRAYPVGTLLRKTYLDELPQIWNIVKGEMSFVGPRPERPQYVAQLEKQIPFYRMRELVLPGITGWAQINMENDASVSDAPEKIQYDLYYIKNRSIVFDAVILMRTAFKLLQRSGR